MSSLIIGNQGFDCVIKGFRIGRSARRPHWQEGSVLTYSKDVGQIFLCTELGIEVWDPDDVGKPDAGFNLSQDLMATDWEIYTL